MWAFLPASSSNQGIKDTTASEAGQGNHMDLFLDS